MNSFLRNATLDKFSLCGVEYQVLSVIFISWEISNLTKYRELTFQFYLWLCSLRDHITEGLVQADMNLYKLFRDEIFFVQNSLPCCALWSEASPGNMLAAKSLRIVPCRYVTVTPRPPSTSSSHPKLSSWAWVLPPSFPWESISYRVCSKLSVTIMAAKSPWIVRALWTIWWLSWCPPGSVRNQQQQQDLCCGQTVSPGKTKGTPESSDSTREQSHATWVYK